MKYVKTFEQFSSIDAEELDENLIDKLKGLDALKKYWKIAVAYYEKMGKPDLAKLYAKHGLAAEASDWKEGYKCKKGDKTWEAWFEYVTNVASYAEGKLGIDPTGGSGQTKDNKSIQVAKTLKDEFKKDSTVFDALISKLSKE